MEILLLVLAVVVLIGGLGVVALSRYRSRGVELEPPARRPTGGVAAPPRPTPPRPVAPPTTDDDPDVLAPERLDEIEEALAGIVLEEDLGAPGADAVGLLERPRFRDRLARARSVFTGAFGAVRG